MGFSESESSLDQTIFSNSHLVAENGSLNISTNKDANIIGANLLASDINLNVGEDLTVKSRQNLLESAIKGSGSLYNI